MIKSDFKNSHSNISMTNTSQCAMLKKSKSCISWSLSQLPPCSRLDSCSQEICHSGHYYFKGRSLQQQPSFKLKTWRLEWKKKKKTDQEYIFIAFPKNVLETFTFGGAFPGLEDDVRQRSLCETFTGKFSTRESFWLRGVKAMTRRNER